MRALLRGARARRDAARMPDADPETTPPTERRRRPTGWILTAAVLAVVAVALGVWAFSAQSDADDAQAKLDAQQAATAGEEQQADASETQQRYEDVKEQLGITGENLEQIDQQVEDLLATAEDAEQARTEASDALDRATADVEAFKARAEAAQGCLRGTFEALDSAFAGGGLEAAVTELEGLSTGCRSAGSP
jgi:hypothetical protein